MTSEIPGDAEFPLYPLNNDTDSFYFSTYVDYNTVDQDRIKENKNISGKPYPDFLKYKIDFNEYLKGISDDEYSSYYEGFKEINRLDQVLFEKIVKEKEVKLQSIMLQKQIHEELEKIKKTGRIEMRDEKANTEKFFSLTWSPKHHSSKKDDLPDSLFAYSPFLRAERSNSEDTIEYDSSRSISTMVNEYTEKKIQDLPFDKEDKFLEYFRGSSESIKDKILQREVSSADIVEDTNPIKAIINECTNEGLKDVTTDQLLLKDANLVQVPNDKSLNQEVSDIVSNPASSYVSKLVQVSSDISLNSTLTNMNPDQMGLNVAGSSQNINSEPLTPELSDVVLDQVVLSNTGSSQNSNYKSLNQSPCGQVLFSDTGSCQNINIESPNKEPSDVVLDQVVLSNTGSSQRINIESPHQAPCDVVLDQVGLNNTGSSQNIGIESPNKVPSDVVLDQVVLSNTGSSQRINIESPHQAPCDVVLDQVGLSNTGSSQNINIESPSSNVVSDQLRLISEGSSQYVNDKSVNQSPSDQIGLNQSLREVDASEVRLSLSNESLHLVELSEMPSNQVQIKEMTSSQKEQHTQVKKKTKKNFIKRNIQLAKDADSVVSMTPEEKNRIDNLLHDLDTLCETPKELQNSDLATENSLLCQREDGFLSSREDKANLAEIDYKLRYLMTPSEFEMVALKRRSPTPTQRIFSTEPSPDTFELKQFGEKILLDTKEERNNKERLKKIDDQLYDINARNVDNLEVNTALEPDVLQDLLKSCAVSLTESGENSLCTTARSTNSSFDEDLMLSSNRSRQSPSDALSSIMKSPPCLADNVLQKLLAEAAPMKYNPLSPISDMTVTPDSNIFRRSSSNLSSCTLSCFSSPQKELFNSNQSANQSPSKVQDYSLPELSCRANLVGHDVSSHESTPRQ